ncbi:hypothetical protein OSTOST_10477, partial [Ostertagia ostertagi]
TGETRLVDVRNDTTTLLYYGDLPQASTSDGNSTTTLSNILDSLIVVDNIDLMALSSKSWPEIPLTPYSNGPLVGVFALAGASMPAVSAVKNVGESLLTLAPGQVKSLFEFQQAMGQNPVALTVSGALNFTNENQLVLEEATLQYEGNSLSLTYGKESCSIRDVQWQASENALSVTNSITKAVQDTLNDPLWSDLQSNLDYEIKNYNQIFNSLPLNPAQIRYVEGLTKQQWAEQATRIAQETIGRKLVSQIQEMFGNLENCIADKVIKAGELPYNVTFTEKNNTMVVLLGDAEQLLNRSHHCQGWT